jgi:hypothetical protein
MISKTKFQHLRHKDAKASSQKVLHMTVCQVGSRTETSTFAPLCGAKVSSIQMLEVPVNANPVAFAPQFDNITVRYVSSPVDSLSQVPLAAPLHWSCLFHGLMMLAWLVSLLVALRGLACLEFSRAWLLLFFLMVCLCSCGAATASAVFYVGL